MNYHKIYGQIINNAKGCILKGYIENHHIIPRCMGGAETVELTAKEHFIAHHLLTKIYPNSNKLGYAFWGMCNQTNSKNNKRDYVVNATTYETAREAFAKRASIRMKNRIISDETRRRMSEARMGKTPWNKGKKGVQVHSKATRAKMSKTRQGMPGPTKGMILTEEHKRKISEGLKGKNTGKNHPMYGKHHSKETKKKMSKSQLGINNGFYGKHHTNKTKEKISRSKRIK